MINDQQCVTHTAHDPFRVKRISWSAVLVGALVGLGTSFLLNMFSVAIGLSLIKTTPEGMVSLALGGFLGMLIGIFAAMFASGFVAGYLGKPYCSNKKMGALYGFTAWCVGLILMVMLYTPVAHFLANYMDFVAHPTAIMSVTQAGSTIPAPITSTPKTTTDLGMGTFLVFVLFFIGALSASIGGHCGMNSCCKEKEDMCSK
jgi:hypothetical protein